MGWERPLRNHHPRKQSRHDELPQLDPPFLPCVLSQKGLRMKNQGWQMDLTCHFYLPHRSLIVDENNWCFVMLRLTENGRSCSCVADSKRRRRVGVCCDEDWLAKRRRRLLQNQWVFCIPISSNFPVLLCVSDLSPWIFLENQLLKIEGWGLQVPNWIYNWRELWSSLRGDSNGGLKVVEGRLTMKDEECWIEKRVSGKDGEIENSIRMKKKSPFYLRLWIYMVENSVMPLFISVRCLLC